MSYGNIEANLKSGGERFSFEGAPLAFDLLSFWRWSGSDLLGNALRGHIAEYIVSQAIGSKQRVREEWDSYDLVSKDGIKVEVKSSAYLQSWAQKKVSTIKFGVQPTLGWDANTSAYEFEKRRHADAYVFCVLKHQDKTTVDPLNLDQWEFYVAATNILDEKLGEQKSISLSGLLKLGLVPVAYSSIETTLLAALSNAVATNG